MATQAVYEKLGSQLTYKASGGSATFTPKNISNGAGRISARLDLGALARPTLYRWYAETQAQATPTVNNLLRIYGVYWDDDGGPGSPAANLGSSDAAFATENDLLNLTYIGNAVCRAASADTIFTGAGFLWWPYRYMSVVWWNALGSSLTNDDAEHIFRLTPVYPDIQAAA